MHSAPWTNTSHRRLVPAQIAAISGTRPGMGAGSRPASAPAAAAPAAPATLGEAIDQLWADAGPSGY